MVKTSPNLQVIQGGKANAFPDTATNAAEKVSSIIDSTRGGFGELNFLSIHHVVLASAEFGLKENDLSEAGHILFSSTISESEKKIWLERILDALLREPSLTTYQMHVATEMVKEFERLGENADGYREKLGRF